MQDDVFKYATAWNVQQSNITKIVLEIFDCFYTLGKLNIVPPDLCACGKE